MQNLISNDKDSYSKVIRRLLNYADTMIITCPSWEDFTETTVYENIKSHLFDVKISKKWPGKQSSIYANLYYYHFNQSVVNEIKLFNCFYQDDNVNYSPIEVDIDIAFLKDGKEILYSITHEHEVRIIDQQLAFELKQMGLEIVKY